MYFCKLLYYRKIAFTIKIVYSRRIEISDETDRSNEWKLNGEPLNDFWFIYQSIEPWLPRPIVTVASNNSNNIKSHGNVDKKV